MGQRAMDAHVHLFAEAEIARLAKANHAEPLGTLPELLAGLEKARMDGAIVANFLPVSALRKAGESMSEIWDRQRHQNAWTLAVARASSRLRVLAGAFAPLDDAAIDHLVGCLADPLCAGIKLHAPAGGFDLADDDVLRLGALVAAAHKTVLVHAGIHYPGHPATTTAEVMGLIQALPRCRIVVARLGGAGSAEALALLRAGPDVWLDTSNTLLSLPVTAAKALLDRLLSEVPATRLIHGSDFPSHPPAEAMQRLLRIVSPADARTMLVSSARAAYGYDDVIGGQQLATSSSVPRSPTRGSTSCWRSSIEYRHASACSA